MTHTHIHPYTILNHHAKQTPEREDEIMRPPEDLRCANYIRIYPRKSKETCKIDTHRSKETCKKYYSLLCYRSIYT